MNKVFSIINKSTKILLLLGVVVLLQQVNIFNSNAKITNENLNKTLDLNAMAFKYNEIKMNDKFMVLDTFTGDLTGYGALCPACNGHLGCTGKWVGDGTTTYDDLDYGNVRIVASSKNLPCGSIVRFSLSKISSEPVIAIVLDRGVLGNDLDLLVENNNLANTLVGRNTLSYDILRTGWTR